MLSLFAAALDEPKIAPEDWTVMTYNLRYNNPQDGPNAWPNRRAALIGVIKKHDPDVLGVQEALADQIDELKAALPGHDVVGVGRDDGLRAGEFSAIFVRRARLGLREGGTRWISPNPDIPGSLGGSARITRIFSWGEFFIAGRRQVRILNAHFDHQSESARLLGATQMAEFCTSRSKMPTLLMGDFNCSPSQPPVQHLIKSGFTNAMPKSGPFGTFNGFKPAQIDGDMIDHVLFSSDWTVIETQIDRTLDQDRAPSDHWPVIAKLRLNLN